MVGIGLSFLIVGGMLIADRYSQIESSVVINEICYNFSLLEIQDGEKYIELYNPTDKDIDISGYKIANNGSLLNYLEIDDAIITAKGYKNIYINEDWDYLDFSLSESNSGANIFSLYLYDEDKNIIDMVTVPSIHYDTSYGRIVDGEKEWGNIDPTPEQSNNGAMPVVPEHLNKPVYSVDSGFYEDEFWLEIETNTKGGIIYYTTDGSEPDVNSNVYEGPILIYDNSNEPNRYASNTAICPGYDENEEWVGKLTQENVTKGMVIRSVVYSGDGKIKSDVETKTYFVGAHKEYENMAMVSLVADPQGLFSDESGIMVAGNSYGDYMEKEPETDIRWVWRPANYRNKGKKWEREAHIDFFDKNHTLVMEQEVGIRIKGGATRAYPQKSFNVYARSEYEQAEFKQSLFESGNGKYRLCIFGGANDQETKIRDVLAHNLCAGLEFCTMESVPAQLFINGEYWGCCHLTEKFDEYYIQENYGVLSDDVHIIKVNQVEAGDTIALEEYQYFQEFVNTHDFSNEKNYLALQEYIDLESYIDYYAVQTYIARSSDWPTGNWAIWRSAQKNDLPYYDGKYRWILFDLNYEAGGMSEGMEEADTVSYIRENDILFDKLMENADFQQRFAYELSNIANVIFEEQRVLTTLDELSVQTEDAVKLTYDRFHQGSLVEDDYEAGLESISNFFRERKKYIMNDVLNHCNLKGTYETVYFSIGDELMGDIWVNGTKMDLKEDEWEGQYYTDFPLILRAVPKKGYQFAGWSGDIESDNEEISIIIPEGGMNINATFIKK